MRKLTPEGEKLIADIANRHQVSEEAARVMLEALAQGGGSQAQFNHYELGGYGQWQRGGMIMIGDMFNNSLKYKVDGLASELSNLIANEPQQGGGLYAPSYQSQSQSGGYQSQSSGDWSSGYSGGGGSSGGGGGGVSAIFEPMTSQSSGDWWPTDLGSPSSVGSQNDMRYAYFPGTRRLALYRNGRVEVLDTGEHQISGFGQQQGGGDSITLSSQLGTVSLDKLRRVEAAAQTAQQASEPSAGFPGTGPAATPAAPAAAAPIAAVTPPPADSGALLSLLEKLGELRDNGLLSEEEFTAKKAEILKRL